MIKKILWLLFILFLSPLGVKADSSRMFYLDAPIPGVYTMMDKGYKKAANYVKVIRRKSDGAFVYCVMPGVAINDEGVYDAYDYYQWEHLNISEKTWEKINLIAYYGYQYNNHQDLEWYAVTQYLIWLEVLPDGWDVYFTDKLRGEKTNKFDDKINEILTLVNNYYINPTISQNIELDYLESRRIIDYNNVLNDYELISNNNIFINSNYLDLNNVSEDFSFKLKLKTDGKAPILYEHNNAQSVITRGSLPTKELSYNVHVKKGQIKVSKKAVENIDLDFESPLNSLQGAKYAIYNDSFYQEYSTDYNGIILTDYLKVGKYYIKEISPSLGYELDETIYEVDVYDGIIKGISVWEKPVVTQLNIKKYYNDWDKLILEENAVFGIYDLEDTLLIQKETNNIGELIFKIPFGEYKIKQINGKAGYWLAEEEMINVTESLVLDKTIINESILSEVNIIKTDENKEIIKNMNFQFKIYDTNHEQYISYGNNEIFSFGKDGKITLPFKLPYGTYIIEELDMQSNYYETGNKAEFVIDENNYGDVEVNLINKEKRYSINILKQKQIYQEEKIILVPGVNIKFCLYASEDILKNEKLIYEKDVLVDCQMTNHEAIVSFTDLWYGSYYILEEGLTEDYEIVSPIEVNFEDLNSNLEIINYLRKQEIEEVVSPNEEVIVPEEIIILPINVSKLEVPNPQTDDPILKYFFFLKLVIIIMILEIFWFIKQKNAGFSKKN